MNCRKAQPQLFDFSFGRLEAEVARAIAMHLERCADCRRVLRRETRMAAVLEGMTRVGPRSDGWPAIEAALQVVTAPEPRPSFWKRPLVWAGGFAAATALTVSLLLPGYHRPAVAAEPDMRAFAPAAAAGLSGDRSSDPLLRMQSKVDRLLERVSDEGS